MSYTYIKEVYEVSDLGDLERMTPSEREAMDRLQAILDRDDDMLELVLEFEASAGSPATRWHPGDAPELEIISVKINGEEADLDMTIAINHLAGSFYSNLSEELFDYLDDFDYSDMI